MVHDGVEPCTELPTKCTEAVGGNMDSRSVAMALLLSIVLIESIGLV